MMKNNLGIFLFNTDSEIKLQINNNNFNKLKYNFNSIIIIDINNDFSINLKNNIVSDNDKNSDSDSNKINIYKYLLNNKFLNNDLEDINIDKILYVLNDLIYSNFHYITFINDNYIYCDNLKAYFEYIDNHNLEFYSYTDSTEHEYHFQLYLFSIYSKSLYKFIELINTEKNNILFKLISIFETKMPFLKIGYNNNNIGTNIFYNNKMHECLVENNMLPIINIHKLFFSKNNFKYNIFTSIPDNFDINIYKSNNIQKDLLDYSDEDIYNHFLNYGQFEFRQYCKDYYVLSKPLREKLTKCNLLHFFDVPNDFNIHIYREKNTDLHHLNINELLLHWIHYGNNEGREF